MAYEARYQTDDFEGEDRLIVKTPDGRAFVLPNSARRLKGPGLEVYGDLMQAGLQLAEIEDDVRVMVATGRELGLSWQLIGAALGLTGEGARRRYA